MKEHLWNIFVYVLAFVVMYYYSYEDHELYFTAILALTFIGAINVFWTLLAILGQGLQYFWDATVNYSKNKRKYEEDEI